VHAQTFFRGVGFTFVMSRTDAQNGVEMIFKVKLSSEYCARCLYDLNDDIINHFICDCLILFHA
jgi:hypothetical protein